MDDKYVLIVDDNPSDQIIASTHVEAEGYVPVVAKDGHEAIDKFEEFDYCLFMVDLQMPRMGGIELIKRIRRVEEYKKTPIMVFSARKDSTDVRLAMQSGANEYLLKPIDGMVFHEKFQRIIGSSESWTEYEIDPESLASKGKLNLDIKLTHINEIGIRLVCDRDYEKEEIISVSSVIFGEEVSEVQVRVTESKKLKDAFEIKGNFIGINEAVRKNIRVFCREVFREEQAKKNEP